MREPYVGPDGRIHHSWHNLATFGWGGYLQNQEIMDQLTETERVLLSLYCWNHNMMYVCCDNPNYNPNEKQDGIYALLNGPKMTGKSVLPTELRDALYNLLRKIELLENTGTPKITGKGAGIAIDNQYVDVKNFE